MAIDFPGELLSASSGSAGDVVASRNQYGPYTKPRVTPTDPATSLQISVRDALATCCLAWNNTLTQSERDGWERYALAVRLSGRLGRKNHVAGVAMYVRSNVPRLQAAEVTLPRIDVAPTLHDLGPFTPLHRVVLNYAEDTLHPVFTQSDPWVTENGAAMLFWASPAVASTRTFYKGPYRFLGSLLGSDVRNLSPGTLPLPVPAGATDRVFIRGRVTRADGRLSNSFYLPADPATQAAPVPIRAWMDWTPPRPHCMIHFDQPLRRETHWGFNYEVWYDWIKYRELQGTTVYDAVRLPLIYLSDLPHTDVVQYTPPPNDVHGIFNGTPAVTFYAYPID